MSIHDGDSINRDAILIASDGEYIHVLCSIRLSPNGIDCSGALMPRSGRTPVPFAGTNGLSLQLSDGRMIAITFMDQHGNVTGSFIDPTKPYAASVLVRNVRLLTKRRPEHLGDFSPTTTVDFGEFSVREIGSRDFEDARTLMASDNVYQGDWVLEKRYPTLPGANSGSLAGVGGIPDDLEDLLFLLRLYSGGDLAFVKIAITKPNGQTVRMSQYDIVNDLNSYADQTRLNETEKDNWLQFANEMRSSPSWQSTWFLRAKKAFLRGGSREFNPGIGILDRIADYMTALEAALVPVKGFIRKRLMHRGARLIHTDDKRRQECATLLKRLYDVRSTIVHGNVVSADERKWLRDNQQEWEHVVRSILGRVVELIADDKSRHAVLSAVYDISDHDRIKTIRQKFSEISDNHLRRRFVEELMGHTQKSTGPASRKITNYDRAAKFIEANRPKAFPTTA